MKILILTQVFYPDNVSVSQHLSDLAFYLQKNGHDVSVISSIYNYEDKFIKYKKKEDIDGVKILRLNQSSLGKQKTHYRIIDFLTFYFNILFKILFLNRNDYDIIIGTTVPPLLSFCASLMSKFKKIKFVYWVMDLQPELSIHSGLIKKKFFNC